jgi:transposase
MLTQGEDVEAHALAGRGWSISSIARHLGRDRKTVRAYLTDQRRPVARRRPAPDPIEPFVSYTARASSTIRTCVGMITSSGPTVII